MSETGRQIAAKLVDLADLYGKELSQTTLEIWTDAISDLDLEKVLAVLNDWARMGDWFPKPSEVRRLLDPQQTAEAAALDAWHAVLEWCRSRVKIPDNSKTRRAVSICGGLDVIGRCQEQELGFMQKRFVEAWCAAPDRDPPRLPDQVAKLLEEK